MRLLCDFVTAADAAAAGLLMSRLHRNQIKWPILSWFALVSIAAIRAYGHNYIQLVAII